MACSQFNTLANPRTLREILPDSVSASWMWVFLVLDTYLFCRAILWQVASLRFVLPISKCSPIKEMISKMVSEVTASLLTLQFLRQIQPKQPWRCERVCSLGPDSCGSWPF
jgi:hypothetical protein